MSKFKVGDKVTMYGYLLIEPELNTFYKGEVGLITDIRNHNSYIEVKFNNKILGMDTYLLLEEELELVS